MATLASSTDEADANMKRTADMVGGDPLPYGIEANRKAMEAIIAAATSQHILTKPTKVEVKGEAEAATPAAPATRGAEAPRPREERARDKA